MTSEFFALLIGEADESDALMNRWPDNVKENMWRLRKGISCSDWFPDTPEFVLSDDWGTKLLDLIPNSLGVLIISARLRDIFSETGARFEFFPINIRNQNGIQIEKPYFFANLLDSVDCVDMDASDYDMCSIRKDEVEFFDELVLRTEHIPADVGIFRLSVKPVQMILSQDLLEKIRNSCRGVRVCAIEDFGDHN